MLDIMIGSLVFAFFGVMMFIGAMRFQMTYDKEAKWWKWCFAPLGVSLIFGLQKVVFLTNYAYLQTVNTRKALFGHYLSFIIPVICVVAILLYNFLKKRGEERRVY